MRGWARSVIFACVGLLAYAAPALAGSKTQKFQVVVPGVSAFTATLPADSVATYRWQPGASSVESWITTPEEAEASEKQPGAVTGVVAQSPIPVTSRTTGQEIAVEPSEGLQEVTGFGGAMTESAALMMEAATFPDSVFDLLFGSASGGGAGLTIARVPLGPSDFTAIPELPAEEPKYTGKNDETFLVPALKHAKAVNPALKLLATPWSAPPSFKIGKEQPGLDAKKLCKGSNDYLQNYAGYANYLTEAVSFYEHQGLPVWMLSLQNEPHNCNSTYPTMKLEPKDEAELAEYLHTDLQAVNEPPELLGWDHNWWDYNNNPNNSSCKKQSATSYPETLFGFAPPIQALGFHSYCPGTPKVGSPQAPGGGAAGVPFYVTESTGEDKYLSAASNLPNEVQSDLIDPLRIGAKGSLYWNLALDEQCGPQYAGNDVRTEVLDGRDVCKIEKRDKYTGCILCRPFITVDASGDYRVNQDYYYWAQLSKFFPPGAHIIASSTSGELDSIAAEDPNGAIVVTVLNGATQASIPAEPLPETGIGADHELAEGGGHGCALLTSGHVRCWGENYYGQLGDGAFETEPPYGADSPVEVHGVINATQITAGSRHTCALLPTGHVQCWGENFYGQLGDGAFETESPYGSDSPVEVHGVINATQIAAGYDHVCALRSTGHIQCWGYNYFGQLGDGAFATAPPYGSDSPVEVRGVSDATQIAAGTGAVETCALLPSGHVQCWGDNEYGALGDGKTANTDTPVEVKGIGNATQIAVGGGHACAVLSTGHIECWGYDGFGQLGDGNVTSTDTPVEVHGVGNAIQIAAGYNHTCALLSTGHIQCWGLNASGQLGDGNTTSTDTPVEVSGVSDASQIAAGAYQACALLSTEHIQCWGANEYGELGDGNTTSTDTPVEVSGIP